MKFTKLLLFCFFSLISCTLLSAESIVILHTNDTHSQIDPDEKDGMGGVLNRKAIIDSVRAAEKNVLLVDAGDAVQGTLYFKFFKGEVDYPLLDLMGYDARIVGNHEFDNGTELLAYFNKNTKVASISTNYNFDNTPLKGLFKPYLVKKTGGKKVGLIGLNIDPQSLISEPNIKGVVWNDVIMTANNTAKMLKEKKKCDIVIALTHIGYVKENAKTTDVELAESSRDIDIIIGGHSHTLIDGVNPMYPHIVKNAIGENVLIAQTGKAGKRLGYIKIDFDKIGNALNYEYRLIPVNNRFEESEYDSKIQAFLEPYSHVVDSINSVPAGVSLLDMDNDTAHGPFANWVADFASYEGQRTLDSLNIISANLEIPERIDFGLMNVGGIRQKMHKGIVTEGRILSTFPFSNRMVIVKIKGSDLRSVFKEIVKKSGEAISNEVRVLLNEDGSLKNVIISNVPLDDNRYYYISTIDYLAWGNDDLNSLKKGKIIYSDDKEMCAPVLRYIRSLTAMGMPIVADTASRYIKAIGIEK